MQKKVCVVVKKEIQVMCADSSLSILREKSKAAFEHFSWESIKIELQQKAPVLCAIIMGCCAKKKVLQVNAVTCMCAAMLMKLLKRKI